MALLRRGSSKITEENFNSRLQREKAKTGTITASLAWNDPSDLDLHANIVDSAGAKHHVYYSMKEAAGGKLDVDMHACDRNIVEEPVENIFWKKAPAGDYSISVVCYDQRGDRGERGVPFRALLKREDEEDLSVEGVGKRDTPITCFRFKVDEDGNVEMLKHDAAMPAGKALGGSRPPMRTAMKVVAMKTRAMKAMKVAMKASMKVAMKKVMKASIIARGKRANKQVYKGQKLKTTKGITKDDLTPNKRGKIVSKKRQAHGQANKWIQATAKARAEKAYTGYKPLKKGTSFYAKTKEVYDAM